MADPVSTQNVIELATQAEADAVATQNVIEYSILNELDVVATQTVIEIAVGVGGMLGINCGSPPAGAQNVVYSHFLGVFGGALPYALVLVSGSLPTGLNLNPVSGQISGVPTVRGTFVFRIRVTDTDGATADVTCSIYIASPSGNCPGAPEDA